ncbi:hypothetical protein K449DRAFT_387896 [Hypoxylon sp. EC38]|nr:hypothetical protein K449DRAFT_387896 [Hypoxylon sp. EC38]
MEANEVDVDYSWLCLITIILFVHSGITLSRVHGSSRRPLSSKPPYRIGQVILP